MYFDKQKNVLFEKQQQNSNKESLKELLPQQKWTKYTRCSMTEDAVIGTVTTRKRYGFIISVSFMTLSTAVEKM